MENNRFETPPEQTTYASILEKGKYIGLLTLFITYFIYVFGIVDPYISFDDLPHYWSLNVHEYVEEAQTPTGWSWLTMIKYGDILNFLGIVILGGTTIICFLGTLPVFLRQKDYIYALIALIQALILIFAASGILKVGH